MSATPDLDLNAPLKIQQLEDAVRELEAFSYSVCHELRAPLQQIISTAELLLCKEAIQDDQNRSYLTSMVLSAKRMAQLINHLLAFSQSQYKRLNKTHFSMGELLTECLFDLESDIKGRNIAWNFADLPSAFGDKNLIRQVVVNLLSNALKFTRGKPDVRIEVGCKVEKGVQTFFLRDNGIGFDGRDNDKVFNAFQRLHADSHYEGTGIGLAIVQRIIRRHGGEVWAEGTSGQGAIFFFSLPP